MEKISNFRSLGGYRNANGQAVKAGLIYRSGQLFELDEAQEHYLAKDLGIKQIVDMRSADERAQFPDTVWPGADYAVLDILKDATANNASLGRMITEQGSVRENMLATYEQLAVSSSAQTGYRALIQALLVPDRPTIFHCFAGKDLRTNQERKKANEEILAGLKKQGSGEQKLQAIGEALTVDAAYLQRFFQVVTEHFGSFDQYLHEGLQLSPAEINRFRDLYLTK